MEINFEFSIQEVVYVKPVDITNGPKIAGTIPAYKVVSRIYEELTEKGGVTSYVVRHIDASTPGGGKLYKFTQDELMSKDSYNALVAIIHAGQKNIIDEWPITMPQTVTTMNTSSPW